MKRYISILVLIIIFLIPISCISKGPFYLGNRGMGHINVEYLSINNNGTEALVEFREEKGLWIIRKDSSKKIADYPATIGTWSPSNKLIAYISGEKLIIADKEGNINKELNLGLSVVSHTI